MLFTTGVAFAIDKYVYSHLFARWFPLRVAGATSYTNAFRANLADNLVVTPLAYVRRAATPWTASRPTPRPRLRIVL